MTTSRRRGSISRGNILTKEIQLYERQDKLDGLNGLQDHYQLCLYRGNGRSPPKIQRCRLKEKIRLEQEDWIVVEGMHEAIVSKEEFELAQAVIRGGVKKPKRNPHYYPLKGSCVLRQLQTRPDPA